MQDTTPAQALDRVLRLPAVGSKRFLTTKVDRSVTGLVAQQQCVGPLQLPLADVAVMAQSHFDLTGAATAIGEQPLKVRLGLSVCPRDAPRRARLGSSPLAMIAPRAALSVRLSSCACTKAPSITEIDGDVVGPLWHSGLDILFPI
jgi:hypothetical protein